MVWSKSQQKYARSEKGKQSRLKYQSSEKAKLARQRYMAKCRAKLVEAKQKKEQVINQVQSTPEIDKIEKEVVGKK